MTDFPEPFELLGAVHLVRPAGEGAHDVAGLLRVVERVPPESLFYHVTERLLRHPGSEELPPDDFSVWVGGVLQERELAERLSFAVLTEWGDLTAMRRALIEDLAEAVRSRRGDRAAPLGGEFVPKAAESVPISVAEPTSDPNELMQDLAIADPSVWFYHLIEQPFLAPEKGSLPTWLAEHGHGSIAERLIDESRLEQPLEEMRRRVLRHWRGKRLGGAVVRSVTRPDAERREAGREAVTNLVRRIRGKGEQR